jgi:hypothetical protein
MSLLPPNTKTMSSPPKLVKRVRWSATCVVIGKVIGVGVEPTRPVPFGLLMPAGLLTREPPCA